MLVIAVAPVASVGSPIDSGNRSGRAPNTPDSYTSWRRGSTVRCARLHTMFGNPTPTKQFEAPASRLALAAIIISDFEYPGSAAATSDVTRTSHSSPGRTAPPPAGASP